MPGERVGASAQGQGSAAAGRRATKKAPAGSHTASTSNVDAATVAKAKKAADGKVAPEGGKTKDPAAATQPTPDATKSAAPPSK